MSLIELGGYIINTEKIVLLGIEKDPDKEAYIWLYLQSSKSSTKMLTTYITQDQFEILKTKISGLISSESTLYKDYEIYLYVKNLQDLLCCYTQCTTTAGSENFISKEILFYLGDNEKPLCLCYKSFFNDSNTEDIGEKLINQLVD